MFQRILDGDKPDYTNAYICMQETWIFQRRTLQLPGLIVDHHLSRPNELNFPGCDQHLLCLLLSDGNQQKLTQIGDQASEKAQRKGDFWICPARVSGIWAWESTDVSLMFALDPHLLSQTAAAVSDMDASRVELRSIPAAYDPKIEAIASLFQAELETDDLGRSLYTESLTQVLLIHLLRQYCVFQPQMSLIAGNLPNHRLQAVLDYIHSGLDQSLHLADLAAVAGISQYHFCRLFKQAIGVAPYQYVLQQRMEKAKKLLLQEQHTIAEIALLVGCTDQSRFARQFKKQFGVTPGAWRSKQLKR